MNEPVKLALVGCGGISADHIRGYQDLHARGCQDFVVTACCDTNTAAAERRAAEILAYQGMHPHVFSSVEDMIASGVAGAADVCVPHCFHHTVGVALLQNGFHVMIEKPLGLTIKASRLLISTAKAAGRILATGENIRRYLAARAWSWAIRDKKLIGDVRLVNVQSLNYQPFNYSTYAMKWRGLTLLSGGGMIMDSGAHFADMVQVIFGNVDDVWCKMAAFDDQMIDAAPILDTAPADVEDTWHAVIRFIDGPLVTWTYSRMFYGESIRQAVYYGSEGTISDHSFPFHPFQHGGTAVLKDGTKVSREEIEQAYIATLSEEEHALLFPYGLTDGFAIEVWDFVDAVTKGRKPEMDGVDGLRAKALSEACFEASVQGSPVKYDDVLSGHIHQFQNPIDAYWHLS
jgi:predicted dehydrogenase